MQCKCGEDIDPPERFTLLGYKTCKSCGTKEAQQIRHTIAPLNKSNYYYIHDPKLLTQLNPKRTT